MMNRGSILFAALVLSSAGFAQSQLDAVVEAKRFNAPGGGDRVDLNIAALNSHDGNSAFRLLVTPEIGRAHV